jgi:crotonobetainyl-CoA:carnitine CoA-transferase CaiB-like acyl-CoA transferase
VYACADDRWLTVGALEPKFFTRICELVGRPELADRQYDAEQAEIKAMLAAVFSERPLGHWLALFDGEDVCVGPVATPAEAEAEFASPAVGSVPALGEHTAAWRRELGL